jgi:hypothetical protein
LSVFVFTATATGSGAAGTVSLVSWLRSGTAARMRNNRLRAIVRETRNGHHRTMGWELIGPSSF